MALQLDWDATDSSFDIPMLPAISADGSVIVIAKSEPMRGAEYITGTHPSLELIEKTRDDAIVQRVVVLSAGEADAMFDDAGMKPALRARVVAANAWLADLDRRYHFVPIDALELVSALAMPTPVRSHAVGIGLTVDWAAGRIEVVEKPERGQARTVVRGMTPTGWLAPDHPTTCTATQPDLEMVYGDAARRVVVLAIDYGAIDPDTCVRPPTQIHVVAW